MPIQNYFITVLTPFVQTNDPNLDYYYDFSTSIAEYTNVFKELKLNWQWQPVSLFNFEDIIEQIAHNGKENIILNLCDGDEVNGTPGISVIKLLSKKNLKYTGANERFYKISSSKIVMKAAFDRFNISTSPWAVADKQLTNGSLNKLQFPLIVKPAVSGGSIGVGIKNVVNDEAALKDVVEDICRGYHGWNLSFGGIIAEEFINGPEFTVFIVGSYQHKQKAIVYPPIEIVFHKSLADYEKFFSFERLWEIYEEEKPVDANEDFYNFYLPAKHLWMKLTELSWAAYCAVKGTGYGRVDIRMDKTTGKLFVLEVNAQCGLSGDENITTIGAILRLHNLTFCGLVEQILLNALERKTAKQLITSNINLL